MSVARFKQVACFLVAVLAATIVWNFLIGGWAPHHADNAAVQGLANLS